MPNATTKPSLLRSRAKMTVRARRERSFRVAAHGDDDVIHLRFDWQGGPASLIELRDNETFIHIVEPNGPWFYPAEPANSHYLEWHIFAPGRTLTGLEAFARLNGGAEKKIASDQSSAGGWIRGGTIR